MKPMRILTMFLALAVSTAASPFATDVDRARYLMGTVCEVELPASPQAPADAERAFAEIDRIEQRISTWKTSSELSTLNASPDDVPRKVTPELFAVVTQAMAIAKETGGAFNPLAGALVDVWHTRAEGALPNPEAIAAAVRRASLENVTIAGGVVTLTNGAEFEEGGFGKGYALDRAIEVLKESGEPRALINFGGQIAAYGFGNGLEVDIALPDDREAPALRLRVPVGSVSTSSGSEKTFAVDGRIFSHIIDPRTGEALPPRGSVTVIADRAFDADALSTALYVLGPDEGLRWADAHGVAAVFLVPAKAPHTFDARFSSAARARAREARILNPRIHAPISKGFTE